VCPGCPDKSAHDTARKSGSERLIWVKQSAGAAASLSTMHSSATLGCSYPYHHRPEKDFVMNMRIVGVLLVLGLMACADADQPDYTPEQLQQWRDAAQAHAGQDAVALAQDPAAMVLGQQLFAAHCASCHGSDAHGKLRIPDLVAGVLDYGAAPDVLRSTIRDGRHSAMPKFGHLLGEFELGVMAAYIKSFSGGAPLDALYTKTAVNLYAEHCVACHGVDLKGNPALGASDLTDDSWQFSGAVNGIRMTMTGGTNSICPPHGALLGAPEIELLTAYVLSLRRMN